MLPLCCSPQEGFLVKHISTCTKGLFKQKCVSLKNKIQSAAIAKVPRVTPQASIQKANLFLFQTCKFTESLFNYFLKKTLSTFYVTNLLCHLGPRIRVKNHTIHTLRENAFWNGLLSIKNHFFTWNFPLVDFLRWNFAVSFCSYFTTYCYVLFFLALHLQLSATPAWVLPRVHNEAQQISVPQLPWTEASIAWRERTVGSIVISAD